MVKFWEFPWWCTKPTKRVTVVQERKKEKQWINCGHFVAIQLTQISQECPHEERGRGPPLTIFPLQIVNFLGKHEIWATLFWEGHHVQMFSEATELCWKTDHLTKSLSCFIGQSHVGVKCVIYCASFWRVHNLGDRPRCVKNERRKRETWTKREELEVKKCMRRDFCARREGGVRKILIWHPRWVNMRIEFGNFVSHQDGFFFIMMKIAEIRISRRNGRFGAI